MAASSQVSTQKQNLQGNMTFWGVVVKPGEPYTHKVDNERPRLRVLLATLGEEVDNGVEGRTVLKCRVGDSTPVSLCNLLPGQSETVNLNVEFEEENDVLFTVLGPCSVHISGNYLKDNHTNSGNADSGSTSSEDSEKFVQKNKEKTKVLRYVTLNVMDAPKLNEELMSEDSRSVSTDSPADPKKKPKTPGKDKPKSKKRKRAYLQH